MSPIHKTKWFLFQLSINNSKNDNVNEMFLSCSPTQNLVRESTTDESLPVLISQLNSYNLK